MGLYSGAVCPAPCKTTSTQINDTHTCDRCDVFDILTDNSLRLIVGNRKRIAIELIVSYTFTVAYVRLPEFLVNLGSKLIGQRDIIYNSREAN